MILKSILFSPFKVDGQKMFGKTSKNFWNKLYPSEETGLCNWALRSLLVDDGKNLILIDTGFNNFDRQILKEYFINNFKSASEIIEENNIRCNQVNYVLHTHMHLDHCGGSFKIISNKRIEPSFPNATYILSKQQLVTANNPSAFEQDSFQSDIISAFTKHSNLKFIDNNYYILPWLELRIFNGHTKGLIIPIVHLEKQSIVFIGDFIPSAAHLFLESTMSYDVDPGISLHERNVFLKECEEKKFVLFFQHDYYNECCNLNLVKNKIVPNEFFSINDLI